jgi:hypothetical protein
MLETLSLPDILVGITVPQQFNIDSKRLRGKFFGSMSVSTSAACQGVKAMNDTQYAHTN